ncbi:hypothetical protein PAMP_011835 [Pampus punctatissimus]
MQEQFSDLFSMNYFLLLFTPTATERRSPVNEPVLSGARSSHASAAARLVRTFSSLTALGMTGWSGNKSPCITPVSTKLIKESTPLPELLNRDVGQHHTCALAFTLQQARICHPLPLASRCVALLPCPFPAVPIPWRAHVHPDRMPASSDALHPLLPITTSSFSSRVPALANSSLRPPRLCLAPLQHGG